MEIEIIERARDEAEKKKCYAVYYSHQNNDRFKQLHRKNSVFFTLYSEKVVKILPVTTFHSIKTKNSKQSNLRAFRPFTTVFRLN